jgi:hypothetical protein
MLPCSWISTTSNGLAFVHVALSATGWGATARLAISVSDPTAPSDVSTTMTLDAARLRALLEVRSTPRLARPPTTPRELLQLAKGAAMASQVEQQLRSWVTLRKSPTGTSDVAGMVAVENDAELVAWLGNRLVRDDASGALDVR